ncbi:MAG TPA: ATP-grasp domain-containing protein [Chitinophagaceae bacterium]|nr:ATP-grasp domain-containing protein [Chitinophagaceae bacterium]
MKIKILVAGLAGASLGTEIIKCFSGLEDYEVYGCDIAPLAYGLYAENLAGSFVADKDNYVQSVVDFCLKNKIKYLLPGGEQPMVILAANSQCLQDNKIVLVGNSAEVITLFSNKERTFDFLKSINIPVPLTRRVRTAEDLEGIEFPCIVKPSSGTGGSDSVFLATSKEECVLYVELLIRNNREVIVQEYIDVQEGEFTIGVLSDLQSNIIGSVAMKRVFNSKLSVAYRGTKGLISSGYSQGLIADFSEIRKQAEYIAKASGSKGPFNVQGRLKNGVLIPFEINPRFSASTYLRNMAGFNEIHLYLQHLVNNKSSFDWQLREGYYLRSFDEMYLPLPAIKKLA